MTRQLILLTFILTSLLASCGQTKTKTPNNELHTVDTSVIAILPFESVQNLGFIDGKPTDLTNDDLLKIETILNKCIEDYNPEQERRFKEINDKHPEYELDKKNFIIDLTRYKRQYVAVLNYKGEKEVWVNCFCSGSGGWLVSVLDGGNCYFNLKINLATEQYFDLMVNGDA